jgi:hypothetical protein
MKSIWGPPESGLDGPRTRREPRLSRSFLIWFVSERGGDDLGRTYTLMSPAKGQFLNLIAEPVKVV